MTLFEYIAVATSILLSLAVVRLLDALPHVFQTHRRSWVHATFVIIVLWACAQYWWVGWSFAAVPSWTYPKFILFLAVPALLYSLARTLTSPDPGAVSSFGEHLLRVHRRFFVLFAVYMVALQVGSWAILEVPALHPVRALQLIALLALASGAFTPSPRYHAGVAGLILALLLFSTLRLLAQPAPLSSAP